MTFIQKVSSYKSEQSEFGIGKSLLCILRKNILKVRRVKSCIIDRKLSDVGKFESWRYMQSSTCCHIYLESEVFNLISRFQLAIMEETQLTRLHKFLLYFKILGGLLALLHFSLIVLTLNSLELPEGKIVKKNQLAFSTNFCPIKIDLSGNTV